jgi:hypothetical protein
MYLATNEAAMLLFMSGAGKDCRPATEESVALRQNGRKAAIIS